MGCGASAKKDIVGGHKGDVGSASLGKTAGKAGLDDHAVTNALKANVRKDSATQGFSRQLLLSSSVNDARLDQNYQIEKGELGKGTYGTVCRGANKQTKAVRAIKTIPKQSLTDVQRFVSEIEVMAALDHPNIVKLHETYEDARNVYLVMECCTGGELFDRIIAANYFMERTAAHVVKQILTAVFYMHNNLIAHRDLKPENFLLANEKDVMQSPLKIIDFGLSRRYEQNVPMTTRACTPYYVAPEVLEGKYNEKCDAWSIGVIMYILLSGAPPFFGNNDPEIIKKVKKGKYDFDLEPWREASSDAKDLIGKLLVLDVAKRFSVKQALEHTWVESLAPNSSDKKISSSAVSNLKAFRAQNKLKKAALTVIAFELSEESLKDLKDMFMALDADNDGTLTAQELKQGILKAGIKEMPDNLTEIMKDLDSDGSGFIDYTEFLAATLSRRQYMQEDIVWSAFRAFDKDGNGQISRSELAQVLSGDTHNLEQAMHTNKDEIEGIIKEVDQDGDGEISFSEFFQMMKKKERDEDSKKKEKKANGGENVAAKENGAGE